MIKEIILFAFLMASCYAYPNLVGGDYFAGIPVVAIDIDESRPVQLHGMETLVSSENRYGGYGGYGGGYNGYGSGHGGGWRRGGVWGNRGGGWKGGSFGNRYGQHGGGWRSG